MTFKARWVLGMLCFGAVIMSAPSQAQRTKAPTAVAPAPSPALLSWALGRADAPVTVIEYGSLTCGHCAQFNAEVLPILKRTYIDTGRVRYVFRPYPTPPHDLSVAMHMLTLCAGPSRYYGLVDAFFVRQRDVFAAAGGETGPKGTIFAIAEDYGGLNYSQAETCLRDAARQDQIMATARAGVAAGVRSTPTVFVNGAIVSGHEWPEVMAAIEAGLRTRASARPSPKATKR
jgi:protein-disulfide isomerase